MASTAFAASKFLPATHLDSSPRLSPLRPAPTANICFSPLSAASSSSLLRLRSPSPSGPGGKLPPPPRSYGGGGGSGDAADSGGDGRRGGILGLFLAGWAARVAADPQFPFKVLMEELVGVSACVLGDMASRPNFGLNELDFVFSTLVVGSILNFVLMYLLAPTAGVSAAASSHLLPESPRSSSSSSTPSPPPSTAPSSRRSRSSIRRCSRTSSCWGWYSTGSDVQDTDMLIHKALMDVNESPVYLLLNPAINHSQKDLPMTIYESELHVIDGSPQLIFVRSNYTIETVEAERISVDHVAHLKPSDGSSAATQLAAHLTGIHSAIKMLNSRVHVIHQYLVAMQRGDIPLDNSLLRQVSSLVRRLPAMESEKLLMGVPCSSIPRRNKPRRVDLYYSSWCIRAVASRRGTGGLTACEVLLFHHEDMGIPYEIAKIGIQQGMWGCVKRIEPGLRAEEDIVVSDLSHNPTSKFAYWIHPDVVLAWRKEVIWLTVVHAIESSRTLMYICAAGCWMMRGGEEME